MKRMEYSSRILKLSGIMKALGHPVRLSMVSELGKGPRCVCELTELAGMDVSTISRHLGILREAGVLDMEKKGTMVIYSLTDLCVLESFDTLSPLLKEALWKAS